MSLSFLTQTTPHHFLTIPTSPKPCRPPHLITYAGPPARDRVIDFGKYKGRMLGTLPSTYLKWVSNNLRARDFEEWANLADEVLEDPVYSDRIEWEFAEKLLHGNSRTAKLKSDSAADELVEISQRFGWDYEDKVGWSRVDFRLLGTSKGGRIPRVESREELKGTEAKRGDDRGGDGRRGERRERAKMKRMMQKKTVLNAPGFLQKVVPFHVGPTTLNGRNDESAGLTQLNVGPTALNERNDEEPIRLTRLNVGPMAQNGRNDEEPVRLTDRQGLRSKSYGKEKVYNRFPGRESLVRKALNRNTID